MTAVEHLLAHPRNSARADPRLLHLRRGDRPQRRPRRDRQARRCLHGYTLDSEGCGRVDGETFSADLAIVTVTGINTHPSVGKDAMVNALRILSEFISRMPTETLSPETTGGRDGFLHPYQLSAGVATCFRADHSPRFRDAQAPRPRGPARGDRHRRAAGARHPRAKIDIEIKKQYRQHARRAGAKNPGQWPKRREATRAAGKRRTGAGHYPRRHRRGRRPRRAAAFPLPTSRPASIIPTPRSNGPAWKKCKRRSRCSCNWRSPGDARKTDVANDQ